MLVVAPQALVFSVLHNLGAAALSPVVVFLQSSALGLAVCSALDTVDVVELELAWAEEQKMSSRIQADIVN